MPMRCVVIGSDGFLGGAIARELLARGDELHVTTLSGLSPQWAAGSMGLTVASCDILQPATIDEAIVGADEVYNLAGVLGTSELNGAMQMAIDVNVKGAVNVFESCVRAGVRRVFYPTKPNVWLNAYTITKEAADRFAEILTCEATQIIRLRWFNAYGPEQHTAPVRKIVPTFCLCARFGLPLPIYGTGLNTTDMIYADDLARWTVAATRSGLADKVYELGTGHALSVLAVAQTINEVAGSAAGIRHLPMRVGEVENTRLVADINPLRHALARANLILGFTPWVEGLEATYRWYVEEVSADAAQKALEYHHLWI